jgi:AcrR family transcriptional regulator
MPPRVKISKTDVINAGLDIIRKDGKASLNARNLAKQLNCSTQPIFSNFPSMQDLEIAVLSRAEEELNRFLSDKIENTDYPPYKSISMAYICFAKCENNLFKYLFLENKVSADLSCKIKTLMVDNTGLSSDAATLFYLETWSFVHGMAVMTANDNFPLHDKVISQMIDDAYEGIKSRFNI